MSRICSLFFLFVGLSWQQKDPLNDFCRRFAHQSAVIDSKLYIDGGFVDWNPISQNQQNYTNTWLLYNDLTTSPQGVGVPSLYANLSKNASIPDVSGGVLWADEVNKRFYLYGGEYNGISPNTPTLLSYDAIYNKWDDFGPPNTAINSVSWGGGVGISELGQGYMLGGWLSNASVPGWSGGPIATSTLIKYEMDGATWTNNTGPDNVPRAEGVMVYIPASSNGLLVYFGGVTTPYNNSTIVASPMNIIYIYDIASSKWYTQTATGDVPLSRRRFCAGAAWAADQSSYNIYLYGGLGFGANATGFDDVYILSLPSFQWVKWWQGSGVGKPHNSLTCNVINKGQMLIIGGTFPLTEDCDSPSTWGTHNLVLGKLGGKVWNDYQLNITNYTVPPEIVSIVGGSPSGGATATSPAGGFNNSDLSVYFSQSVAAASRIPTRLIPSNSRSPKAITTGAIAGIAVGGAIVLIAFGVGICCFCRRRRRRTQSASTPSMYDTVPNFSPQPQSFYTNGEQYHQPCYQLPTNSPPAELPTNYYQMHQVDPKSLTKVTENLYPTDAQWNQSQPSPKLASPHPSTYSGVTEFGGTHSNSNTYLGGTVSPVTPYSTTGRGSRRHAFQNRTYYSP